MSCNDSVINDSEDIVNAFVDYSYDAFIESEENESADQCNAFPRFLLISLLSHWMTPLTPHWFCEILAQPLQYQFKLIITTSTFPKLVLKRSKV